MAASDNTEQQLPEPQQGGSYTRNRDGSLTLNEQTQPAAGRALRKPATEQPADAAPASAGGDFTSESQE
jgi:hypothetical protein